MGFFGMGWQEITVIAVVAIIIFGPDKLPELAGQAGKLLRDFRRMTQDMTGEFEKQTGVSVMELKQNVDKEIAGLKSEMAGTTASVTKEINSVKSSVNKTASSVGKSVSSAANKKSGSTTKSSATAKSASGSKSSSTATSAKSTSASAKTTAKPAKVEVPEPPKASKHDPLADVSFLDSADGASTNGAANADSSGTAASLVGAGAAKRGGDLPADRADALARARSRRQTAGYNQHPPNPN
jgi:sec-independent protein translocase protein TatB